MPVTPLLHLLDEQLMTFLQCPKLSDPSQGFRMPRVAFFLFGYDAPDRVQLAVFTEQMLPAEIFWVDVPDAHMYIILEMEKWGRRSAFALPTLKLRQTQQIYGGQGSLR